MADSFVDLHDVVIIGGGCYGSFYLAQLAAARARGRVSWRQLLVVDRDPACAASTELSRVAGASLVVAEWGRFLDQFLTPRDRVSGDRIVPSPLMPHLLLEWLVRRAHARAPERPLQIERGAPIGTPFESIGADGTRYVSHADWLCPVHCVEPAICPATRAPRTWEMAESCTDAAAGASVALFECHHAVFGVGMIRVDGVLAADARLAEADASGHAVELMVGTVSRCHGAVTRLIRPAFRVPSAPALR